MGTGAATTVKDGCAIFFGLFLYILLVYGVESARR